jgi:hypothetical protein
MSNEHCTYVLLNLLLFQTSVTLYEFFLTLQNTGYYTRCMGKKWEISTLQDTEAFRWLTLLTSVYAWHIDSYKFWCWWIAVSRIIISLGILIFSQAWFQLDTFSTYWKTINNAERFQTLMVASMKTTAFSDMAPCNVLDVCVASTIRVTEAVHTSETSDYFYENTQHNIPEGCHLQLRMQFVCKVIMWTQFVRFQVLTAASMMFWAVFWVVLPCKMIVDNHFTRQYNPEDSSEHERSLLGTSLSYQVLIHCEAQVSRYSALHLALFRYSALA